MTEIPTRTAISPVRGYRTWSGEEDDPLLHGCTYHETAWQSGLTAAVCEVAKCTNPPQQKCTCGLYAWHLPDPVSMNAVLGVVEGQGRVAWCPAGWRASHARIVALHTKSDVQRQNIARNYPGVRLYEDRDELLDDYPSLVSPTYVYGPQGDFAQQLLRIMGRMTPEEACELDRPWSVWGGSIDPQDYGLLTWTLLQAAGQLMALPRQHGVRAVVRPGPQVGIWALIAVLAADVITDADYELLIHPWASTHGDPLGALRPIPTSAVVTTDRGDSSGFHRNKGAA